LSPLFIRFQLLAAHDLSPMKSQADYQLFKERYKMLLLGTLREIVRHWGSQLMKRLLLQTVADSNAVGESFQSVKFRGASENGTGDNTIRHAVSA
jgi:hypothetical protein